MNHRSKKHGSTSNFSITFIHYFVTIFQFLGNRVYFIKSLVEVLEYRIWIRRTFSEVKYFRSKKSLLDKIINEVNNSGATGDVLYFEFGVAFGETARYIATKTERHFKYHGFDTFEGLPKAWRGLNKGAFTNHGLVPKIRDENMFFYKGLIQDSISKVDFNSQSMKCFIFDFDLYEPTLFAYKYISGAIKEGDILYFDEAFDSDERVILDNYFLDYFDFSIIGVSPLGVAFRINQVKA